MLRSRRLLKCQNLMSTEPSTFFAYNLLLCILIAHFFVALNVSRVDSVIRDKKIFLNTGKTLYTSFIQQHFSDIMSEEKSTLALINVLEKYCFFFIKRQLNKVSCSLNQFILMHKFYYKCRLLFECFWWIAQEVIWDIKKIPIHCYIGNCVENLPRAEMLS